MLILTRSPSQSIMVGDNVIITILSVKGCQVRLGVQAPKSVPVHREEVYERIRAQRNQEFAAERLQPVEGID